MNLSEFTFQYGKQCQNLSILSKVILQEDFPGVLVVRTVIRQCSRRYTDGSSVSGSGKSLQEGSLATPLQHSLVLGRIPWTGEAWRPSVQDHQQSYMTEANPHAQQRMKQTNDTKLNAGKKMLVKTLQYLVIITVTKKPTSKVIISLCRIPMKLVKVD